MNFKIGDVLDLEKNVSGVVFAIEYNSVQTRYQLYVVRRDNGCKFVKDIGYNSKSKNWYESNSGFRGGKFWRKMKNIPTIGTEIIDIPKINIFKDEEPDPDDF